MVRRIISHAPALGAVVAVGLGIGAARAAGGGGFRGSPAAVRVAEQVLAHSRHVTALQWRQGGDQWECPSDGGPIVGPAVGRPARGCRRATVTFDENLTDGRITRSESRTTAAGLATQTELVTQGGDWSRSGRERCWDSQSAGLVNTPAFSYKGERLSILAQTPSLITLRGVGDGFRETDTIDAHTFSVRVVDERVPEPHGSADLVARFTEMTRPFVLPEKPSRVCSDIVRFPPYPAR